MVSKHGRGRWRKSSPDGVLTLLQPLLPRRVTAALRRPAAPLAALLLTVAADVALCGVLFADTHAWRFPHGAWRAFWAGLHDFSDAADVAVLAVARLLVLTALNAAALAVARRGLPRAAAPPPGTATDAYAQLPSGPPPDEESPPQPQPSIAPAVTQRGAAAPAPAVVPTGDKAARKRAKRLAKAALDRSADDAAAALGGDVGAARAKAALQLAAFTLSGACQLYLGIKAVVLPPAADATADHRRAALLFALVAAAHAEQALAAAFVDAAAAAAWAPHLAAAQPDGDAASSAPPLYTDGGPVRPPALSASHYLRWSLSLAAPHARAVAAGSAALLLGSAAELAVPRVGGAALDAALRGDGAAFRSALQLSAALQAAAGGAAGVRGLCFAAAAAQLLASLSVRLYRALLSQDVAFFDAAATGDLLSRLTEDVKAATEPANWILSALTRAALQAAGGAAMCVHISWRLTLLAGAAMGPVYGLTSAYAHYSRRLQKARAEALGAAAAAAADALGNARLVRACSAERAEAAAYARQQDAARDLGLRDARSYALTVALNDWVTLVTQLVLLAAGGHLIMRRQLSVGALVAFQAYFGRIDASWQAVLQFLQSLTAAAGSAERVLAVLELRPAIGSGDVAADADVAPAPVSPFFPGPVAVAFDDVAFTYALRPGAPVLRGLSLSVPAGATAALVGASGSGKSTMVALLMRFYDPQSGTVAIGGLDLRTVAPAALHAAVALVAQDAPVFAASIEANMAYGLERYTQEELRAAAAAANALEFVSEFEQGFATVVGERGVRLSGGQRQRLALARALLRRPQLLLLDEATSALDAAAEAAVQAALDRLLAAGGHTVLLVAHRLSTVRDAHLIALCAGGAIAESGTHEALMAHPGGAYARLVERQLDGARRLQGAGARAQQALRRCDEIEALIEGDDVDVADAAGCSGAQHVA